ncbi:MAG: hypothetical protein IIB16_07495 [Chloroflexi bacterium]|nr:hypothetical protein [Chloroflexota bacterium]
MAVATEGVGDGCATSDVEPWQAAIARVANASAGNIRIIRKFLIGI